MFSEIYFTSAQYSSTTDIMLSIFVRFFIFNSTSPPSFPHAFERESSDSNNLEPLVLC